MHTCVCVYMCKFFSSFVLFSIPYSWLPNSLFLLDTGIYIWATTRCRPCHRTFLLGFPRFRECACYSWLRTEILCLSEVFIFYHFLTCICLCFQCCLCERVWVVTSVTLIRSRSSYTCTYTDTQAFMFVCLLFWVYLTAGGLTLIRSRSSYNHTYQHAYLCVCACIFLFFFCLFWWVYPAAGCLTLCFSSIQDAGFVQQPVVGPTTGHFFWAFIASVSVRVSRGWVPDTEERYAK